MRELADPSLAAAHPAKPGLARFSPDGKTLITSGHDGTILVWDAVSLTRRHLVPSGGEVRGLDIARQMPVAVACGNDRGVLVFDDQSGQVLHRLTGFTRDVLCVAISADDAIVAAADRTGSIRILELESGRLINRFPGHGQYV